MATLVTKLRCIPIRAESWVKGHNIAKNFKICLSNIINPKKPGQVSIAVDLVRIVKSTLRLRPPNPELPKYHIRLYKVKGRYAKHHA